MKRLAVLAVVAALAVPATAALTGNPAADGWALQGHSLEQGTYVRGSENVGFNVYSTYFTVTDGSVYSLAGHDDTAYLPYYETTHWTKADARAWQTGDTVVGIGGVFESITAAEAGWDAFTGKAVNSTIDEEYRLRLQAKIGTATGTWSASTIAPDAGDGSGSTSDGGLGTLFLRTSGWHALSAWEDFAGVMLGLQKTSHISRQGASVNADVARVIWTWDELANRPASWQLLVNLSLVDADAPLDFDGLLPGIGDLAIASVQVAGCKRRLYRCPGSRPRAGNYRSAGARRTRTAPQTPLTCKFSCKAFFAPSSGQSNAGRGRFLRYIRYVF